jgi:hypothetical protein
LIVKALRGLVKSAGRRLPVCSTASFQIRAEASVPATLAAAAKPLLEKVEALNRSVAGLVLPPRVLIVAGWPARRTACTARSMHLLASAQKDGTPLLAAFRLATSGGLKV